jgi:hypothetical protein
MFNGRKKVSETDLEEHIYSHEVFDGALLEVLNA